MLEHEPYPALCGAAEECARESHSALSLARLVRGQSWDPAAFVDLVRDVVASRTDGATATACRRLAQREWELLFEHCYRGAVGVAPRGG